MYRKVSVLFVAIISLFIGSRVSADVFNLDTWMQDDIYFVMRDYNGFYLSMRFPFYSIDGVVVYCIEPGVSINTSSYVGETGFNLSPFSDDVNNVINLIGYYGYNYTSHDTVRYRMATQALIWEYTGNKIIEFYTKQYGYGEYIDVSYEKSVIMELVNNHYNKPSFDEEVFEAFLGDTLIIEDYNGVLGKLEVLSDGGNDVVIEGNTLYVTVNSALLSVIEFGNYRYDNEETVIFIGNGVDSQMMGKFRLKYDVHSFINIKGMGKKIRIKKVDYEDMREIKLRGIGFKIYDTLNDEYICESDDCIFFTDDNGEVVTKKYYNGNYEIIELEDNEIEGYVWNNEVINLDTNSCDMECEVLFPNKRVVGNLSILKYGEKVLVENNNIYYSTIRLCDVRYELYAFSDIVVNGNIKYEKDSLIGSFVTLEDGMININDLEIGKYYLKEISSNFGNMVSDDIYYFDIEYNSKYENVVLENVILNNYLPKGRISVIKEDDNGEMVENTLINLYYKYNDEYVLVGEGYTDINGSIVWDNLPLGEYYVYEKESALGYVNNYEKVMLSLDSNMDSKEVIMENKRYIEVPNTLKLDDNKGIVVGIFNILFSMGMFLIAKKIF